MATEIQASVYPTKPVKLQAKIQPLLQDINASISSSLIYAFSPVANVTTLANGNYLITITDKLGTTTAEVPNITDEKLDYAINLYFSQHPILQQLIEQHNLSESAHADIRLLIQNAIDQIPINISQLINDKGYISNFKELLVQYPTYWEFPNIPPEDEKDMIFLDKSTGDMFVFGLNNSLTYTSIGISNQDAIIGGDSASD